MKISKTFWDLFWHIHLSPKKRNGWVLRNPEIDSLRIAAERLNPTKEMTFCQRSRRWKVSYAKWARRDGGIGSPPRLRIVELWYQSKNACPSRFLWHGQRRIYPTWISKCVFMMAWHFSTNLSWPDYDFSWDLSWTMKKLVLFIWISSESTPKLWSAIAMLTIRWRSQVVNGHKADAVLVVGPSRAFLRKINEHSGLP